MQLQLFIKILNQQLVTNLANQPQHESIIDKYQHATKCHYEIILQLKSFILNYSFSDLNEEISFFKNTKPTFISQYIFSNKALQILIRKPIGNDDVQLKYFDDCMREITRFFNENQEIYQYYRLNSNYNDAVYFVRQSKEMLHLTNANLHNFEPAFSSSHDHLLAQIIANDLLVTFLSEQKEAIIYRDKIPHVDDMGYFQAQNFQWTDNKSALIELIYALHTSKSINNGNCDIRELTAYFEKVFNIKINDIYRGFQDIKARNTQTKYIDSLKTSLQRRIDEDYQ